MPSRARILEAARSEFALHGQSARLQDIAERAGLTHPTLLYHFKSKERLYAAVIEQAMEDWALMTSEVVAVAPVGFDRVAALVRAGMEFFATHADFVVIWRREAIEGGGRLEDAMAEHMRPFLERAIAFLEREMAAGRLREHDPGELMQIVYGAVSTYFSDAGFRARLFGGDPTSPAERERFGAALTAMLRDALAPR
ncbi:TetR family transcriptional regulator [Solirubrobacter sp. CPCC 204708]|uniref:TetR family transcriptional regulator n=1 Tax=Solirubrobacter deserti TaxID=2282478 RepID=A0ABT4RCT8_9ACTN|nr:TetR family transcriptional regulator [Solirubrobacter deserti]MBE2317877.1 TetR family transcriptional regulator [Solirubrobacter deserti]MDA0136346.1 TetR family transcriptional regulator [Solirubrobacter deserti]